MKGDAECAIDIAERAIAEDPLEVWPRMNLHAYLQAAGRDPMIPRRASQL
jgi:hypothetical protein